MSAQNLPVPLDPSRNVLADSTQSHTALPEQYVWTAGDVTARRPDHSKLPWNRPDLRVAPHYFRAHFQVAVLPQAATLYIAGPREAHIFLNGQRVADFYLNPDSPIGFHVFHASVAGYLRAGKNTIAIEAIRGRGIVSGTSSVATQQLAYGEVLAAKIVPGSFGVDSPSLLITDEKWRSSANANTDVAEHWHDADFDDSSWQTVESLGPVESDSDFFQWSADAGMYGWPGYSGMSPGLRTFALTAVAVTHIYGGAARFEHLASLTTPGSAEPFALSNPAVHASDLDAPALLLDFGREVAGRLLVESASPQDSLMSISYGESEIEALATGLTPGQQGGNYLGTNLLEVPAHGVARGPKSGFRYVCIRFLGPIGNFAFKSIRVEGIYYPVTYAGSFESSDPLLNRIWEVGAYTAHVCMQDGIWDAVKRDRGRWVGDLDVEGRVISTAFGDRTLIEQTLHSLVPGDAGHVNGIPSYSALWITSLADLYLHTGDKSFLASEHEDLLRILAAMDASVDAQGLFTNAGHQWLFVDWAPGLYAYTPEARLGTQLEFIRGYRAAVTLLESLGDVKSAERYRAQLESTTAAAHRVRDPNGVTYGSTWQLNALSVLAENKQPPTEMWDDVLSRVKQDAPADQVISPYFNGYVLDAMAEAGHRREAMEWIRTYWGGMLAEGATSFWESYDLRWPKANPHLSLQADGTSGYFVSMAHGWSSLPAAWLVENVLGITPTTPGYATVSIRPDLLGLEYANGSVPTPHGTIFIRVDAQKGVDLELPAGVEARVEFGGRISVFDSPGHHAVSVEGAH